MTRPTPLVVSAHASDEDLLDAARVAGSDALGVLWHRHHGALLGYARRLVPEEGEAEEIVQQAFVRAAEGRWQRTGRARAWLFTVVHRAALDRLRTRSRWRLRLAQWIGPTAPATPEEQLLRSTEAQRLETALARLPVEHRSVLLLYYGQELASKEVVEALGCSDQQVRSRLSYARELLRAQLEEAP